MNAANLPPVIGSPTPINGSTNQSLSFTFSIPISDPNGDLISWTIHCSNGQTKTRTQTNGTKSMTLVGLAYSRTYTVWVNATDPTGSGLWTSRWYTYSTQQLGNQTPPVYGSPVPANGSIIQPPSFTFSIHISDPNGDLISWTIHCSNGQTKTRTGQSNGTYSMTLIGLTDLRTYTVWVNATDPTGSGLYTRRWYMFTRNSQSWSNTAPTFSNPSPDGSTAVYRYHATNITVTDPDTNQTLTVTFYNNNTGSWVRAQQNTSIGSSPVTFRDMNTSWSNSYNTKYWWKVTAYDGLVNSSVIYTFTTKTNLVNNSPVFGAPSQMNGSTWNLLLNVIWSIPISDPEGNPFSWTIQCSNGQTKTRTGQTNGTYSMTLIGLTFGKTYKIWVNATDPTPGSGLYTRRWYTYITKQGGGGIQQPVLKWQYTPNALATKGPLAVDVNSDGILEIFLMCEDKVTCLNGSNGHVNWIYTNTAISNQSQAEIGDLNNDGIPEIVLSAMTRTIALHANDGSVYWNVAVESQNKNIVIADLDGNHFPYVFTCSEDVLHGASGTGRLRKLNGQTGAVLKEVFVWRPCYGSLSYADANNDGRFEIYMTDRASSMNFPNNIWAKGMQCYDAETLQLRWYEDDVTCSSHFMALIDVNKDGVLDAVALQEFGPGSVWVVDGKTGERMPGKWEWIGDALSAHSMFPIYDIDGDGNLELATCSDSPLYIWDLGRWALDTQIGTTNDFTEPPKFANVEGDQQLEIIATCYGKQPVKIYSGQYTLLATIPISGNVNIISSSLVQDINNDGLNELLLVDHNTGTLYAYDTPAITPTPQARGSSLYYSERRMGAGEYVPPPGAPQPIIKEVAPANQSIYVKRNPTLSAHVIDFHYDRMNITISTNASGSWTVVKSFNNAQNGFFSYTPTNMNSKNTRYYWRVTATDPYNDKMTTQQTYWFVTALDTPDISNINPPDQANSIPVNLTQLRFNLNDYNGNQMTYTVQTSPNIGSRSATNVYNDTISVPVSGLSYFTTYHWYINVTDGTNWNRKVFSFMTKPQSLIADSSFNACTDSSDLRTNGPGQDWYESYNDNTTLLSLDISSISGNSGKKAKLTGNGIHNVYLSQELTQQQNDTFSIQFDVYVDEISNGSTNVDLGPRIFIGDDADGNHGPCSSDQDRYVNLAFRKDGGGTTGPMELVALDRYDTGTSDSNLTQINQTLHLDTWYTIRITIDFTLQRYNVYLKNSTSGIFNYQRTVKSKIAKDTLTHISFANLPNSYGTFYIDNVIS